MDLMLFRNAASSMSAAEYHSDFISLFFIHINSWSTDTGQLTIVGFLVIYLVYSAEHN